MLEPGMTRAILLVHGHRCQYCGGVAKHADHIIPVRLGGTNDPKNLTAACASCNCAKGSRRLQPEHEREMLREAWVAAGVVADLVRSYSSAIKHAKSLNISRAGFIKMSLSNALKG